MVLAYAFLLGLFILGLVASLAIVHANINPNIDLSVFVILTVLFGIYPAPILDGLHYSVSSLIYNIN